jgi:hypothetical protein
MSATLWDDCGAGAVHMAPPLFVPTRSILSICSSLRSTDPGQLGEKEIESQSTGRFSKRSYTGLSPGPLGGIYSRGEPPFGD